ncbi:MAG: GreA/GreB family elongation factor [Spirochaetota bacterium]|nr:MAG: GreA/GreB family elongation factor [Spirochaetota bacterium]
MNNKKIVITDCDHKCLLKLIKDLEYYEDCNGERRTFINNLKFTLKCAAIVTPKSINHTTVTMNSRVRFENLDSGKQSVYTLVLPDESDILKNNISIMAPMGIAILGHKIGDIIKCDVPKGVSYLKIIDVEYQPEAAGVYQS